MHDLQQNLNSFGVTKLKLNNFRKTELQITKLSKKKKFSNKQINIHK